MIINPYETKNNNDSKIQLTQFDKVYCHQTKKESTFEAIIFVHYLIFIHTLC